MHAPHLLPGRRTLPAGAVPDAPHGTTIVALTYAGGVVMAGDRRATMGNLIAHREIEKVFAADEYSCVGIAGTAGIAIELVRLFQVELEHYEKIEGTLLSLDGKANRLASMIRGNLGMAMQGLAVVPLFAGFDLDRGIGRIFSYDVTGGRYEEHDHHSVGSGSLFARGSLKKLWRPGLTAGRRRPRRRRGALRRRRRRLGHRWRRRRPPDLPGGRHRHRRRGTGGCPTTRSRRVVERGHRRSGRQPGGAAMTHAVLRLARAADEGPGRLRAQGHRARPLGRRAGLRRRHRLRRREPLAGRCTRSARSTTGSPSPRSASTTSSRTCGWPGCATPTCAATPTTAPTSRPAAWRTPTPRPSAAVFTTESKPLEVEIVVAEVGADPDEDDQVYRLTYDGSVADEHGFVAMGGEAEQIATGLQEHWREGMTLSDGAGAGGRAARPRPRRWPRPGAHPGAARGGGARPAPAAPHLPADRRTAARAAAELRRPDQ